MKNLKDQKGITLVALVITIIVLLILAGVSLSLVVGDNGILGRAANTAKTQREAEAKENVVMELVNLEAEYYELKYSSDSNDFDKVKSYTSAADAALKNLGKDKIGGTGTAIIKGATVTSAGNPATITVNNGSETVTFEIAPNTNDSTATTFIFTDKGRANNS